MHLWSTDFIKQDVSKLYKDLLPHVKITLVEAGPALLGPFDAALQNYTFGLFEKRDIDVRLRTAVTGVDSVVKEGYHFPSRQVRSKLAFSGTKLSVTLNTNGTNVLSCCLITLI